MKYFRTFEGFKKEYMKKIDLKDFKKIKKKAKLTYMGGPVEVIDNNGYILTLKGEDGKIFTVNKSQFDHGGFIKESKAPDANKAIKDLEKVSQIDYLDDADTATKKIWKKAGVNTDDENTIILYSYVSDSWPETIKILKKYNIDYKELEDPNSAGESFIVFVKESVVNEAKDFTPHKMYDPETGDEYEAEKPEDHERMAKLGYVHEKPESVDEAVYIPSNIEEFAKRRGVLPLVKKIGRWAEKAGKRINGGTAIGKGYGTLILDLRHQGGEIRINLDNDEVTLHGTIINDPKSFKKALKESESINEGDMDNVKKDIMDHWFELYGEKFINEYPAVAKILKTRKNIDRREFARIWDATYQEDFKEKYPAMWDKLD